MTGRRGPIAAARRAAEEVARASAARLARALNADHQPSDPLCVCHEPPERGYPLRLRGLACQPCRADWFPPARPA